MDQTYIENVTEQIPSSWHGASYGVLTCLPTFKEMMVSEVPGGQMSEDIWLTANCCTDAAPVGPEPSQLGWGSARVDEVQDSQRHFHQPESS